jgi:uncharacterized membrane protein
MFIDVHNSETMEDNANLIESLLEGATEYGKTGYELVKLKVVDKTSDGLSSFLPHTVVVVILGSFLLFLNLGIALWLGEILGKYYYGFFVLAAFYALLTLIFHFFMRKWLKRLLYDYIIKQLLN